jgi:hypothetical protein
LNLDIVLRVVVLEDLEAVFVDWDILMVLQEHLLQRRHDFMVKAFILVHARVKGSVWLVDVELGIAWLSALWRSKCTRKMMELSRNPKDRRPPSLVDRAIFGNTDGGKRECAIVLPDVLTKFHSRVVIGGEKGFQRLWWHLKKWELDLSFQTACSEFW